MQYIILAKNKTKHYLTSYHVKHRPNSTSSISSCMSLLRQEMTMLPCFASPRTHRMLTAGAKLKLHVMSRFFRSKCSQRTHNILLLSPGWEIFWYEHSCGSDLVFDFYSILLKTEGADSLTACCKHTCRWTHIHTFIEGNGLYGLFPIPLPEMSSLLLVQRHHQC